ncbi:MAG: polyhydroxybutyrate depolymerase [Pseudomonadota bacterium]
MRLALPALFIALLTWSAPAAAACPPECETSLGAYSAAMPEGEGPFPVLIHLHGMGGTGPGTLKGGTARRAVERGYAVLAPTGWQPVSRYPKNWGVADGRDYTRDDIAFLREVLADAAGRFPLDTTRVLLSGFSRGGSMVWDVACQAPDFARAYAPVAGAFWDPLPTGCAEPVDLFHTHGWLDRTVPLEGRPLDDGRLTQGDVWASLFILRATNGCGNRQPKSGSAEDGVWLRHWDDCAAGQIDLMLHPGGHGVPSGWADRMLDWFEAVQVGPAVK